MARARAVAAPAGIPPQAWIFLGLSLLGALGFLSVVAFLFDEGGRVTAAAAALDRGVMDFFLQYREPATTGRVIEVSAMGSAPVLIMLALLVYSVILRAKDGLGFVHLGVMLLGSGFLSRWLQGLFDRARPEDLLSYIVVTKGSFPSAHVFGATACYLTFAFFYARYAQGRFTPWASYAAASFVILLIGATRVYLGAHHTTDVLAGVAGGAAWAFLMAAAFSLGYRAVPPR